MIKKLNKKYYHAILFKTIYSYAVVYQVYYVI